MSVDEAPPAILPGAQPSGEPTIAELVLRDKIRMSIEHLYSSLISGLYCGGVLVAFFLTASQPAPLLPLWIGLFLLITVFRFAVIWKLKRIDTERHSRTAFLLFFSDAVLAGGSWGVIPFLLMSDDPVHQAFTGVITAGIGAGGIIIRAPLKAVARPFIVVVTAPLIIKFFSLGTSLSFALGALSLAFPIVLLLISNQIEAQLHQALTLNYEKQELVRHLSRAKEAADQARGQAEAANRDLNLAVEKAMAATEAKGRFLANVSHEIRTPMNGVLGMTHILLATELSADQRDMVSTVKGCAEALLVVINDILDFSKIEAGKIDLIDREFDSRACFEAVTDALAFQAAKKHLGFSLLIRNDVPAHLRGDADRIRQVLMNLAGNALKFTDRGEVRIDVSVRSGAQGPSELLVEIHDTGIGIPPDLQSILFQPFSQVDPSNSRRFGGTGLGLVICKNLVDLMGGMIGLESQPGRGSTFWFRIPLKAPKEGESQALKASVTSGPKRGRVLIVEASPHQAAAVSEYVAWAGYEPVAVERFYDALSALRPSAEGAGGFVLALISMNLSNLDGLTLAERIRLQSWEKTPPMILLVDPGMKCEDSLLQSAGIAGVLRKPVKRGNLVALVRRILGDEASGTGEEL